jgi:hypothetical protein
MKYTLIGFSLVLALAVVAVPAHADHVGALTLLPGDADWTTDINSNLSLAQLAAITGFAESDLVSAYKQDVGAGSDSGPFGGSYTTTFSNSALDPEDALIEWDGPGVIGGSPVLLLVKDGNQSPAQYIFDITAIWDGTQTIHLQDFWPAQGAISHIEIFGGEGSRVPEPFSALLFGTGLLGLGLISRKRVRG